MMKLNFQLLSYEFGLMCGIRRKLNKPIAGVTNRTQDGYYVPFLDYDEMPYSWIRGELEDIQEKYDLGNLYVFQSGKENFHVVGFDKLTREVYQDLLARSSCDANYKKVPFSFGRRVATLRATEKNGMKIQLYRIIQRAGTRKLSNAHKIFFQGHYNITPPEGLYDTYTDIIMATYKI